MRIGRTGTFAAVLACAIAACSSSAGPPVASVPWAAARATADARTTPIRHVVFLIQENRSFNDLFMGYPGATTQRYGYDEYGNKIALQPIGLVTDWDLAHDAIGFFAACDGSGKVSGTDCKTDVISPQSAFLTDIAKGKLANVTWIAPTFEASDHAVLDQGQGPAWVASVVNAVGTNPFWKSTAIFVIWDDWGGWFDPVPPVHEGYDGLGFRVPLLIVSPYAKPGYVSHVQYETSSVLRFIEDNFGLGQLAKSDTRANDPATDAFDYAQKPRAFKRIPGGKPPAYWVQLERSSSARGRPANMLGDD